MTDEQKEWTEFFHNTCLAVLRAGYLSRFAQADQHPPPGFIDKAAESVLAEVVKECVPSGTTILTTALQGRILAGCLKVAQSISDPLVETAADVLAEPDPRVRQCLDVLILANIAKQLREDCVVTTQEEVDKEVQDIKDLYNEIVARCQGNRPDRSNMTHTDRATLITAVLKEAWLMSDPTLKESEQ